MAVLTNSGGSKKSSSGCGAAQSFPSDPLKKAFAVLEEVLQDARLQALFLQELAEKDKLAFARLLFLVSVDEFKKLYVSHNKSCESKWKKKVTLYASKIVRKYMTGDSFFSIHSETLNINLTDMESQATPSNAGKWGSVLSFGSLLEKKLKRFSHKSLSLNTFHAVESKIKHSLVSNLNDFQISVSYKDFVRQVEMEACAKYSPSSKKICIDSTNDSKGSMGLNLKEILGNTRLCCLFWVFLFRQNSHQTLSFYMDLQNQFQPLVDEYHTGSSDIILRKIWSLANDLCIKYIKDGAAAKIDPICDEDRKNQLKMEILVGKSCHAASKENLVELVSLLHEIKSFVKSDLKLNHFARFMASTSFNDMIDSYHAQVLSPAFPEVNPCERSCYSDSGCSSTTSLQDMMHSMNVVFHQPLRTYATVYTLDRLISNTDICPISAVLSFRMNPQNNLFSTKDLYHQSNEEYHHHVLPAHLDRFFVPGGAQLLRSRTTPDPHLFYMTIGGAERTFYAACLTRYVVLKTSEMGKIQQAMATVDQDLQLYIPVGVFILSRYPILNTLRNRLRELHVGNIGKADYLTDSRWEPSKDQMKELVATFKHEAGLKEASKIQMNDLVPTFKHEDGINSGLSLKSIDHSIEELFLCLDIEKIVTLVACLLLEKKVVLIGPYYSILTSVAETLKSLLSPLQFCHVFAPLLPKNMMDCLHCPTPFLFGLHSHYAHNIHDILTPDEIGDLVVVNLEKNSMTGAENVLLPMHLTNVLCTNLRLLLQPKGIHCDSLNCISPTVTATAAIVSEEVAKNQEIIDGSAFPSEEIRLVFYKKMEELMSCTHQYSFLLADEYDQMVVFDEINFYKSLEMKDAQFYKSMVGTQIFSQYVATSMID